MIIWGYIHGEIILGESEKKGKGKTRSGDSVNETIIRVIITYLGQEENEHLKLCKYVEIGNGHKALMIWLIE